MVTLESLGTLGVSFLSVWQLQRDAAVSKVAAARSGRGNRGDMMEREKPPPSLNATGTVDKAALRNQRFAVEALGLGLFAGADAADGGMAWTSRWVVFPKTQKMPMDTNANAPAITRNQNPGMRGLLVRRLWRLAIVS